MPLCAAVLQSLVAHEAVVAQTSRAQQKAKEAAAAVDAVSSAAQQLGAVDTATNQTLGSLAAAAEALNTIAGAKEGHAGAAAGHHAGGAGKQQLPSVWDLKGRIEQHKQKVGRGHLGGACTAAAGVCDTPVPLLRSSLLHSSWIGCDSLLIKPQSVLSSAAQQTVHETCMLPMIPAPSVSSGRV